MSLLCQFDNDIFPTVKKEIGSQPNNLFARFKHILKLNNVATTRYKVHEKINSYNVYLPLLKCHPSNRDTSFIKDDKILPTFILKHLS